MIKILAEELQMAIENARNCPDVSAVDIADGYAQSIAARPAWPEEEVRDYLSGIISDNAHMDHGVDGVFARLKSLIYPSADIDKSRGNVTDSLKTASDDLEGRVVEIDEMLHQFRNEGMIKFTEHTNVRGLAKRLAPLLAFPEEEVREILRKQPMNVPIKDEIFNQLRALWNREHSISSKGVNNPLTENDVCKTCGGSGKVKVGQWNYPPPRGVVPAFDPCPDCKGDKCSECDGLGSVAYRPGSGMGTVRCSKCGGTGSAHPLNLRKDNKLHLDERSQGERRQQMHRREYETLRFIYHSPRNFGKTSLAKALDRRRGEDRRNSVPLGESSEEQMAEAYRET